jgi:hypothetical protein
MSILDTIRGLIKGSSDAETATSNLMQVLAREAIKTGNPEALIAVAAQWEEMLEGRSAIRQGVLPMALPEPTVFPALVSTPPEALRDYVIKVMQSAYLGGCEEITTGDIQKGVDRLVRSGPGWTDADLEDLSEGAQRQCERNIRQIRWKVSLSTCMQTMRRAGDIRNADIGRSKTYVLSKHLRPALPPAAVPLQLEPTWEPVISD